MKRENKKNQSRPLFTGDYMHDSSVSEYEKLAEASNAVFTVIKKRNKKNGSGR